AHDVVRGWTDFHGLGGDVDVAQLLELMIHAGQFFLDVLGLVESGLAFGVPINEGLQLEIDAAVGSAAAFANLPANAAGDMIAREQVGRPARIAALILFPDAIQKAFFLVVRRPRLVVVRDVLEQEALAFVVAQTTTFAADSFGDQNAAHAGGPDHARRVKL